MSIVRQMKRLKLSFEFVLGVLGSSLSPQELAECYNDRKARRYYCNSLVPAVIGCSLSHVKVYREIIARNLSCALILEDDVILPPLLPPMIAEIERAIDVKRPEVLLLSPAKADKDSRERRQLSGDYQILPYKDGCFTSSYIVTQLAARTLLTELYPVGDEADCWLRMKRYKVVDLYVLDPFLVEQDRATFGSSTTDDVMRTLKRDLGNRLIFKTRRAWAKLIDCPYGIYRRNCVPYAGLDVEQEAGGAEYQQ